MAGSSVAVAPGSWPDRLDREWTLDALDTLPDDGLRYEIIDGSLLVSPAPRWRHQGMVLELAVLLRATCPVDLRVFVAPLGWRPDGRTSLEPDLLVVPRQALGAEYLNGTPVLVIEVLSPSSRRVDRFLKTSRYAEGGIAQYWIVDPGVAEESEPTVEIFDLVDGAYRLTAQVEGAHSLTVSGPLSVTVVPAALLG